MSALEHPVFKNVVPTQHNKYVFLCGEYMLGIQEKRKRNMALFIFNDRPFCPTVGTVKASSREGIHKYLYHTRCENTHLTFMPKVWNLLIYIVQGKCPYYYSLENNLKFFTSIFSEFDNYDEGNINPSI